MADFRKWLLVFAVVALLSSFAVTANAQAVTCAATAGVPPVIRAEGVAEQVGDVVLNCSGGVKGAAVGPINVQVFLNAFVTPRLTSGTTSDALLLLNEPTGAALALGTTAFQGQVQNLQTSANGTQGYTSIVWTGIPFTAPGSGTVVLRITNVRVDALSAPPSGAQFIPQTVQEFVSISGVQSVPVTNPQITVGYLQPALASALTVGSGNFTQCAGQNVDLLENGGGAEVVQFGATLTEGFASAFKLMGSTNQSTPGTANFTENGFTNSTALPGIGLANSGTRFWLNFSGVASGLTVFVPISVPLYNPANGAVTGTAVLQSCDATGTSCKAVTKSTGTASATLAGNAFPKTQAGTAFATFYGEGGVALASVTTTGQLFYEVTSQVATSPFTVESVSIPVAFGFEPGQPVTGTGTTAPTFTVGLAPQNTDIIDLADATKTPIPRFGPSSVVPNPGTLPFTVGPCQCNLLFTYVTSRFNYDTGIAVSNTSMDPWGTLNQHGPVKFYFYGQTLDASGAPVALTTAQQTGMSPDVPAGTTYAFSVYSGDSANGATIGGLPNFSGYVIANASFQYCHGLAFISGFGRGAQDQGASEAYLGLVLDSSSRATGAVSESLNH